VDPTALDPRETYKLMTGFIVPRPIAWISTQAPDGTLNLAPFSFFNGVGANPPAVSVSILHNPAGDRRKDTWRNIEATGEFVVNVVDEDLARAMNETSTEFPPEVDEFEAAGLEPVESVAVKPPRVAAAPVSLECTLLDSLKVGEGVGGATLVVGKIELVHVRNGIANERNHVDIKELRPVSRLAGAEYGYVRETFSMNRNHYDPEAATAVRSSVRPPAR
jgi:flavin reductase (DIM6/NTAB) family NADH-FMN oxidoreductase RutF